MGQGNGSAYLQPSSIMDADIDYDCLRTESSDQKLGLCIPRGHF